MEGTEHIIERTLATVLNAINTGEFKEVETELLELKGLSTQGNWNSLKQSVCAFLNTQGGYIICGITEKEKEKYKAYTITGFDRHNESNIIDLMTAFKNDDGLKVDLSGYIELKFREFEGKTIAVIYIKPYREDLKYINYAGKYYERFLTQDREIPVAKLNKQREHKAELVYSKEITPVLAASIDDLEVEKINEFILRIKNSGSTETIKKDINDAVDFLKRRHCVNREGKVTTLGLLLFGKTPFDILEQRAEIDCYYETGDQIGRDKKYFKNDVLSLMTDAFAFVWGHIKVGRSYIGGGRSEPEFPEALIREVVNNALAHRDYTVNQFITIKINPGKSLEIKNPGSFKQKMLLTDTSTPIAVRRVIPGMPESKNPKLANILKTYDKVESQGIGMSTLVTVCLEDQIDVPYYDLSNPDAISVTIPSGKLLDEETNFWLISYESYLKNKLKTKPTLEHKLVLAYLYKSEKLNQRGFYTILLSKSNNHLEVLFDLHTAGIIQEHFKASQEHTPVYVLHSDLTISDFTSKIEQALHINLNDFEDEYKDDNKDDYKKVLNIIYRYNHYNLQSIKPSVITPELYRLKHGKEIIPTKYETLGRRVRKVCNILTVKGILRKKDNKAYEINIPNL